MTLKAESCCIQKTKQQNTRMRRYRFNTYDPSISSNSPFNSFRPTVTLDLVDTHLLAWRLHPQLRSTM